jgi:hypothetical protein
LWNLSLVHQKTIVFSDEGQAGLEIGRDDRSGKVVAYMSYSLPHLYKKILTGLKAKPIPGRFSVEAVDEVDKVTPICDSCVKNATLAEIVQWVGKKYYAHLNQEVETRAEAH